MFYYHLEYEIDATLHEKLMNLALNIPYSVHVPPNQTSQSLQVSSVYDANMIKYDIVTQIEKLLHPDLCFSHSAFLKFPKNKGIDPHIDLNLKRQTCLVWALHPNLDNFAPVTFYDNDLQPFKVFYRKTPMLLNTQKKHSVENTNFDRYSFQICFNEHIDQIYTFHKRNGIFVNT